MADGRVERRLAAILAADVAGYSRLMGDDEEGTLAQLNDHRREFLEPQVAEHRGRIVKKTGDGVLIEFASAVDAVRCAVDVQRGMAERNRSVPHEKRIELRMGIHIGDIIIEEDDIFGDGVNIAARIESLSQPGSICISDDAYRQIRGKLDVHFDDMGEQQLKNITQRLRVYQLQQSGTVPAAPMPLPDKPSIAVLPFQNMSGDAEQDYFADGMVEDIITGLSRIKWLFVIARNSSFAYKGRSVDVKQVGRELGVRYVLEGSVRKTQGRVRITAQLINAEKGAHIWAERAKRKRPENLDAYDLVLRATPLSDTGMPDGASRALPLLELALSIDPDYALAHGQAAFCHEILFIRAGRREENRSAAIRHAHAAVALGPDDAPALVYGGIAIGLVEHDRALSLEVFASEGRPCSAGALLLRSQGEEPEAAGVLADA